MADARPLLRRQRIVLCRVPQERDDVTDRGKADAHHDRIACAVDELEDRAVVEARRGRPRDLDMAVVEQTPREAGRRDARIGLAFSHRQGRTGRVGNRIDQRADEALLGPLVDVAVAEQPGGLGDELLAHHAGNAGDGRKMRRQAIGARRHVTLPAVPHQREAEAHQEAVTGVLGVPAVRCTVEPRHDRLVAAIGHVVYEATIAAIEIERLQDAEVALIFDVTARVARGPIEVDDTGIQAMCRIEFAEHRAVQPLIGPTAPNSAPPNTGVFPSAISIRFTPPPAPMMSSRASSSLTGSLATPPGCRKGTSSLLLEAPPFALRSRSTDEIRPLAQE